MGEIGCTIRCGVPLHPATIWIMRRSSDLSWQPGPERPPLLIPLGIVIVETALKRHPLRFRQRPIPILPIHAVPEIYRPLGSARPA